MAAQPEMHDLLQEFGPPRRTSPAYPFHHLQTDGLLLVRTADGSDPGEVVVRYLLAANFPESLHADICEATGLDLDALESEAARARGLRLIVRRPPRDPAFRREVMAAYEYERAICGFDGRLGNEAVGLEAAHVKWWAFEGPDTLDNGLCLCSLHHKLFDRGVLGVSDPLTVDVSPKFAGSGPTPSALVVDLLGRDVLPPRGPRQSQHRSSELAPQPGVPWTGPFSRVAETKGLALLAAIYQAVHHPSTRCGRGNGMCR